MPLQFRTVSFAFVLNFVFILLLFFSSNSIKSHSHMGSNEWYVFLGDLIAFFKLLISFQFVCARARTCKCVCRLFYVMPLIRYLFGVWELRENIQFPCWKLLIPKSRSETARVNRNGRSILLKMMCATRWFSANFRYYWPVFSQLSACFSPAIIALFLSRNYWPLEFRRFSMAHLVHPLDLSICLYSIQLEANSISINRPSRME